MTVLENMGRVRNAKKLAKQMGVTIRRSVPDEVMPLQDRYETVASIGFDSKSARLAPSGEMYTMKSSPTKAIVTSTALMGGAAVSGMYAYRSLAGPDKDLVTAAVSSVIGLVCLTAIAPFPIDF